MVAAPPVANRSVTPDQLSGLKRYGIYEAHRGRLVEKRAGYDVNWTVPRVAFRIGTLDGKFRDGDVLMRQTFQCFEDRTTVRRPDVAFLAPGRVPNPAPPDHLELRPDLAVEVVSEQDDPHELDLRLADYHMAGVPVVWVVTPAARTVRVLPRHGPEHTLRVGDTLAGGDVLPGFAVPVADLFRPVDPPAQPRG